MDWLSHHFYEHLVINPTGKEKNISQNKTTTNDLTKRDKVLLIFALITAVIFSVVQEKLLATIEYIYLLCLMPPIMFWWILDPEKNENSA